MKLIPMSRKEIESFEFKEPSIAICIAYPNGRLHKVKANESLLAVFHTRFSDCDEKGVWAFPDTKTEENIPIPMTKGQAIDIIHFVEKWKDRVGTIYIACYGGISRSAGIGAGLAAVYGWPDKHIYDTRIPNVHCKRLIMQNAERTFNP